MEYQKHQDISKTQFFAKKIKKPLVFKEVSIGNQGVTPSEKYILKLRLYRL